MGGESYGFVCGDEAESGSAKSWRVFLGGFPGPSCFKFRNVSPRNERQVPRATQNDDPDLRVPVELCDRTGNRLPHGHRDGVATFRGDRRSATRSIRTSPRTPYSKFSLFSAHESETSPGTETWKFRCKAAQARPEGCKKGQSTMQAQPRRWASGSATERRPLRTPRDLGTRGSGIHRRRDS